MRLKLPIPWVLQARAVVFLFVLASPWLLPFARPAAAQGIGERKWEVEVHGGGTWSTNPSDGTVRLPGPGEEFRSPLGLPSRRVSSWYFGDGTTLFNQVGPILTQVFPPQLIRNPELGSPQRITALDPVLGRSLAERRAGGSFGVRVSRTLTPRLSAEVTVDYSLAPFEITSVNSDAIEATRASFLAAFGRTSSMFVTFTPLNVTSTAVLTGGGHQAFASGTLNIHLRTTGNIRPYAAVGAGVISRTGKTPSATLTGNYHWRYNPLSPSPWPP